jgi:molybdate transport system substrate-binding protein
MAGSTRESRCRVAASASTVLAALVALATACAPAGGGPEEERVITVFAAASTADLVSEVAALHEAETGVRVRSSFAASSTLARQIESGARADVFLSAHVRWMDALEERGLVRADTRRDLLANALVLVAATEPDAPVRLERGAAAADAIPGRLAIADPEHVPAGLYARQALEWLGWWEGVRDRVVPALDVRAALRLAEMGQVDAAVVYASDARASSAVTVLAAFPPESHDAIRYPVALVRDAGPGGAAFVDRLVASVTPELAAAHGFREPSE